MNKEHINLCVKLLKDFLVPSSLKPFQLVILVMTVLINLLGFFTVPLEKIVIGRVILVDIIGALCYLVFGIIEGLKLDSKKTFYKEQEEMFYSRTVWNEYVDTLTDEEVHKVFEQFNFDSVNAKKFFIKSAKYEKYKPILDQKNDNSYLP